MTTILYAVAFGLFLLMATFVLWGVVVGLDRTEKVNELLPLDKRFGAFGWYYGKSIRFEREYERLFPDRKLRHKELLLFIFAAIALISACVVVWWS